MVVMGGGRRAGHRSAAAMSGRGTSDWAYLAVLGTADSLANTGANEVQIRGRLAAARSEGTHPSAAVIMGKGAAKARKSRPGAAVGSERAKNGLSR
jgi:hypothetical protein